MVGATQQPIYLGRHTTNISLPIHRPSGPAHAGAADRPRRVFLKVENITSDQRAPTYDVYLGVPPGDDPEKHPELTIGCLAMFGLVEASRTNREPFEGGLAYTLEATEVYAHLTATRNWDADNLRVAFVPPRNIVVTPRVKVGRVCLYFE